MFEDLMFCCSSTWNTFFFPPFTEFYIHNFCSILLFAIIVQQSLMLKGSFYMWLLQGLIFDPQSGSTLHIELARANSRTKRSRSEDAGPGAAEKKFRGPIGVPGVPYPDAGLSFFLCSC
jgi:hypothetical protein